MKRCLKGKSCKSTCIFPGDVCRVYADKSMGEQLDFLRDTIQSRFEVLSTPKEAADWLLDNKETLASWAISEALVNEVIKTKPGMITFGLEPGYGQGQMENLKSAIPELKNVASVMDSWKGKELSGPYADMMLKANAYKLRNEVDNGFRAIHADKIPAGTPLEASKTFVNWGMNTAKIKEQLEKDEATTGNYPKLVNEAGKRVMKEIDNKKLTWGPANALVAREAGLGSSSMYAINTSGLAKPSKNYGQFGGLFEKAGVSPGPFATNASWYKYSREQSAKKLERIVKEAKPKLLYFGGSDARPMAKVLDGLSNEGGSFKISTKTKDGTEMVKPVSYKIVNHPDKSRTILVFGPHTGGMGMGNKDMAKSIGQATKTLLETGKPPTQVASGKIYLE